MNGRLRAFLWPLLSLALFLVAIYALRLELRDYRYRDVAHSLRALPLAAAGLAILFTLLNYAVLTGYDVLALRYIRRKLPYRRVALASSVGYAFSTNVGLSAIASGGVRYRFYSAWGLSGLEIAKVVVFYSVTFWLGLLGVGGLTFILEPMAIPPQFHLPLASTFFLGWLLLVPLVAYLAGAAALRRPITLRGEEICLPSFGLASAQTLISALDWVLAAAVLYALLPGGSGLSFLAFLGIFLLAQFAGVASHVPGGLGIFEGVILAALSGRMPPDALFAALIAYRVVYYLLPLVAAALALGIHEALARRETLAKAGRALGGWMPVVAPRVIALLAFVGGTVLLLSGATPTLMPRLVLLRLLVPLPVVEASHFLGSLAGVLLLLLARGLQRRLDAAYVLAAVLLAAGAFLSVLKGLAWEEAVFLLLLLLALLPCRRYFYRKSSLFGAAFSPGWIAAILLVVLCAASLGFFAYKHVEYRTDLWWHFAFRGEASRFLRASVGVAALGGFLAVWLLLRPAPPEPSLPTEEELKRAEAIVAASPRASAHLALLGDKSLFFSESGGSFLMYAVSGRSWVVMGDPVGPGEEHAELLWRFLEEVDRHGDWAVFYEVTPDNLPLYLDLGLDLVKVGEEARVDLEAFSLEGPSRKALRYLQRRLEREGCTFEVRPAEEVPGLIPQLKAISDQWLEGKRTREKGFSMGSFEPAYLARGPVALALREGHPVAFASLWPGGQGEELSLDLMRASAEAPAGTMDYLFINLFLWGRDRGYRHFNLGMAPLSGLESRALAPLWSRLGAFLFHTGEHYYNFQGVRQYKAKFDPAWEPRYIAFPGGISLAPVLANIASLVGRGARGVVSK